MSETEEMHLTAEEIIELINEEIEWIKAEMEETCAQNATTYDLSECMNNDQYIELLRAVIGQMNRHNRIINLLTVLNHIEAAEEEKRHTEMMNHA